MAELWEFIYCIWNATDNIMVVDGATAPLMYGAMEENLDEFDCTYVNFLLEETQQIIAPSQAEEVIMKEYVLLLLQIQEFSLLPQYICDEFSECQNFAQDIIIVNVD